MCREVFTEYACHHHDFQIRLKCKTLERTGKCPREQTPKYELEDEECDSCSSSHSHSPHSSHRSSSSSFSSHSKPPKHTQHRPQTSYQPFSYDYYDNAADDDEPADDDVEGWSRRLARTNAEIDDLRTQKWAVLEEAESDLQAWGEKLAAIRREKEELRRGLGERRGRR